jgi:hypothetical protein
MTVGVSPALRERLIATDGTCGVVLRGGDPLRLVEDALRASRAAILTVRHPDEPDDAFVSYVSELTTLAAGRGFTFDAADVTAYPEVADLLVSALLDGVKASGLRSGTLVVGDESAGEAGRRATALSVIEADIVESSQSVGLPSELWVVAESQRPDGLRDCDLYRVRDVGTERLTTGHFIFGLAITPTITVVQELTPEDPAILGRTSAGEDDAITRLWSLRHNVLDSLPGLGNPECGSFDVTSNGDVAWTSEVQMGVSALATLLHLRRADGSVTVVDEGEATGYFDRGKYLWSPSLHDDGTLAYLSGNRSQAHIVVRHPDGATQSWPLPRGANVQSLKLSQNKLLAVALADFQPSGVGVVNTSDGVIRVVSGGAFLARVAEVATSLFANPLAGTR